MRRWRGLPATLLAATIWSLAVPLAAEDKTIYAREADWDVSRSEWGNWANNFEKNTQPVLEKLFADGVIVEWWFSATSLHSEDGYTHTTGYSANSLANLQRALDALVEAGSNQSEDERRAFAGAVKKHRDSLLRSVVYRSRTAKIEDGYSAAPQTRSNAGRVSSTANGGRSTSSPCTTSSSMAGSSPPMGWTRSTSTRHRGPHQAGMRFWTRRVWTRLRCSGARFRDRALMVFTPRPVCQ